MPKSSDAKRDLATKLLAAGVPYREIQEILKKTFGTGMSNTTFQKLTQKQDEIDVLKAEVTRYKNEIEILRRDLALYKHLYNDLKNSLMDIKK